MSLWRNRNFVKLWIGQTVSEVGSRISREGLPLTAAIILNASPAQMGLLAASGGLAAFLAAPLAGWIADRSAHRPILVSTDIARAALLGLIPLTAAAGKLSMPILLVIAFLVGALTVFFDVHYQAFLPRLVSADELLEGNRKLALTVSTAEVLGPGITGVLVQTLTAPIAILFDAFSFLVSAGSVALIRSEAIPAHRTEESEWDGVLGGFRYVLATPILRALVLRSATAMFFGGFIGALYVLYAIRELRLTPVILGAVIMLGGISNLAGALLAEKVGQKWAPGKVLIGSSLLGGFAALLIPLATAPWWYGAILMGLSQLLGDIAFPLYSILDITTRQRVTPANLIGRVNGCAQVAAKGIYPVGALTGGLLANALGMRAVLFVAVAGYIASSAWLIFSPVRHLTAFDTQTVPSVN